MTCSSYITFGVERILYHDKSTGSIMLTFKWFSLQRIAGLQNKYTHCQAFKLFCNHSNGTYFIHMVWVTIGCCFHLNGNPKYFNYLKCQDFNASVICISCIQRTAVIEENENRKFAKQAFALRQREIRVTITYLLWQIQQWTPYCIFLPWRYGVKSLFREIR